jgi:3-dehydroquinate synthase
MQQTVRVALEDRSYDVVVGSDLVRNAPKLIEERLGRQRCAIVTDENVASRHLQPLEKSLAEVGRHAGTIVLKAGEGTKSFPGLARVCERLLEFKLERADLVVALGGGVIGDLAGLAASLLRRGVRWVQIPTTLLAQVDASVGGKTGINTAQGKNLVGSFHQPGLVLADLDLLATLPLREMRAGYAEVAKYGLLGDAAFFEWLERNGPAVLERQPQALANAVTRSVQMKADIVARDETETGDRALLNLGHTFGHALEAWAGYSDRLLHGEAIAIGLCLAFRFSERLGMCPAGSAARVESHLASSGLPTRISHIAAAELPSADALMQLMAQDKKVRDGKLTFIMARGIGSAFICRDVTTEQAKEFLGLELASES